jgi:hypothetical protein
VKIFTKYVKREQNIFYEYMQKGKNRAALSEKTSRKGERIARGSSIQKMKPGGGVSQCEHTRVSGVFLKRWKNAFRLPSDHNCPGKPGRNALGKHFNIADRGKTVRNL